MKCGAKMNDLHKYRILFLGLLLLFFDQAHASVDHSPWTELLQRHVSEEGKVNYKGFQQDEKKLDVYLATLSANHPTNKWEKNESLAFWINAYNAFTVKLILNHYPVKSIKDIAGGIYKINTPWDIKFIEIGDQTYDLNNIEHGIIRKNFREPRIHFAVNCASISCPRLRNEAYTAEKLDDQLNDQAKYFINNKVKNEISEDSAELSKIFLWFKKDFKKAGSNPIKFINRFSTTKITKETKITYKNYEWELNE